MTHGMAPPVREPDYGLPAYADEAVLGVMRSVRAKMDARGNIPGVRAIDECIPLVADAVLAVIKRERDGLVDLDPTDGDGKVER